MSFARFVVLLAVCTTLLTGCHCTKKAVAKLLNEKLVIDKPCLDSNGDHFELTGGRFRRSSGSS